MVITYTSLSSGCKYELSKGKGKVYITKYGGLSGCYVGEAVFFTPKTVLEIANDEVANELTYY